MGIKVNVSEQEQTSGDRNPLPVGVYHVAIVDAVLSSPSEGDNVGKPMLVFTYKVQDSPHTKVPNSAGQTFVNREMRENACLWDGALYTIVRVAKAIGEYENLFANGEMDIPDDPEFWVGRQLLIRISADAKQKEKFPDMPERHNQIKGASPVPGLATAGASSGSAPADASLLP